MSLVLQGVPTYTYKVRIYKDSAGEWRWRMTAANNKIVADSAESYKTRRGVENAARKLMLASIHVVPYQKGH